MEQLTAAETSSEAYQMLTFKERMDLSPEDLEENFHFEKLSDESKESAIKYHFAMLNNPDAIVGSGDNAIVLQGKDTENICVKCRWEPIPTVNNKSKRLNQLPEKLQGLKKVQDYFELVRKRKSALTNTREEFVAQRKSLHEALLTKKAHDILAEADLKDHSPEMQFVVKIDYEESGMCAENDPYFAHETVYMLYMTKIAGQNLEQMILEGSETTASKIDLNKFIESLKNIVKTLNENGFSHNDLSLRNIMIDPETWEPRIIDFGAATYEPDRANHGEENSADTAYINDSIRKWLMRFVTNPKNAGADLKAHQEKRLDRF